MRVPLLDSIAIVLLLPLQLQLATQDRSSPLEADGDVLKGTGQEEELCCHGGGNAGVAEACECLRWNLGPWCWYGTVTVLTGAYADSPYQRSRRRRVPCGVRVWRTAAALLVLL